MKIARRKLVAAGAAVAAAVVAAVAAVTYVSEKPAAAHGVAMFPGSRTYLCYVDGLRDNGQIIPYNPACADAVAQSGTTPLYNWFAVLDSDAGGRNVGYIPDGTICSAGDNSPYDFAPYNMARTDWPLTHLTAGATLTWRYSNWAHHPGAFHMYITRDGWDPTTPLAWSDLEPFASITDPPQSGGAGGLNYYYWNAQLPAGKAGRHMIFIQWVRSDSRENFFSCSDVVFDGGNGEVTGVGPDQGQPTQSPTQSPTSTPTSAPDGECSVTYTVRSQWDNGFTADVTVTNEGPALSGWTLGLMFHHGQQLTNGWNATWSQTGPMVTARNVDWNASLASGASVTVSFNGTHLGDNPPAEHFSLNNVPCTVT